MRNEGKRFLSLLMALVMVCSLAVPSVFAAEEDSPAGESAGESLETEEAGIPEDAGVEAVPEEEAAGEPEEIGGEPEEAAGEAVEGIRYSATPDLEINTNYFRYGVPLEKLFSLSVYSATATLPDGTSVRGSFALKEPEKLYNAGTYQNEPIEIIFKGKNGEGPYPAPSAKADFTISPAEVYFTNTSSKVIYANDERNTREALREYALEGVGNTVTGQYKKMGHMMGHMKMSPFRSEAGAISPGPLTPRGRGSIPATTIFIPPP